MQESNVYCCLRMKLILLTNLSEMGTICGAAKSSLVLDSNVVVGLLPVLDVG